ncbi:MAG: helix-turn-helix transcriptional regulator [Bacteroidia bacterium]
MEENIKNKLKNLVSKDTSDWKEKAKFRKENKFWLEHSQTIAIKILSELKKLNMTQKALAEKLNIEPQQINKIVKGQENLTLKTICQIENALGITLISVSESFIELSNGIVSNQNVSASTIKASLEASSSEVDKPDFSKANWAKLVPEDNSYGMAA